MSILVTDCDGSIVIRGLGVAKSVLDGVFEHNYVSSISIVFAVGYTHSKHEPCLYDSARRHASIIYQYASIFIFQ